MWAAPAHTTATLGRLACLMVRVTTGLSGLATADEVQEGEVASYVDVVTRRVQTKLREFRLNLNTIVTIALSVSSQR